MTEKLKIILFCALAFLIASAFFAQTAVAENDEKPWNVHAELRYEGRVFRYDLEEAARQLTAEQTENRGVFYGKAAKRKLAEDLMAQGFSERQSFCYVLTGLAELLDEMETVANRPPVDAKVEFCPSKKQKFVYTEGKDGTQVDVSALFDKLLGGQKAFELPVLRLKATTADELKRNTVLKGTFSTTYASSGAARCNNVALAAKAVKGTVVKSGEEFSFNKTVGERSEARGYATSKVIVGGEYVDGVGGGVCQVSTTLYNAALLANLHVTEVHRHTLVSHYVEPSFDAMVSFPSADLRFVNDTDHDVFIDAVAENKKLTFFIYGQPNEYEVRRKSTVLERKAFPVREVAPDDFPELVYDDQIKVVSSGSDYVKSVGYLEFLQNGKVVRREKIRSDVYKLVERVIARGKEPRPTTFSSEKSDEKKENAILSSIHCNI